MDTAKASFDDFLKRREEAGQAFITGDPQALGQIVARELPATFFGPGGGFREGAANVWAQYEHDSGMFEPGSESAFQVLQKASSDDNGYWVTFQNATVRMRGKPEPTSMRLRVTEVFRRESGDWKMATPIC